MTKILRSHRVVLIARIRICVQKELDQLINVTREYTGKEIAERCGLDAARISEILSTNSTIALSENTLRKIIGGGFLKVDKILNTVNPQDKEEIEYINKFRIFEDQLVITSLERMGKHSVNVGKLMMMMVHLMDKGIDLEEFLGNKLAEIKKA